ncbi:MAG: chromosome segregation protein SMC [Candidatus Omnitrophica bacterium]|nr:chromosome segregation protein SMC [Candidatus Omnitrophota bacterium]
MRVKKLDIFGFKSFCKKTTIHFEPGVTAIVGPNGSGKSNIVDSIRWVLGEHNPRDVRAPRLEDVIFNGTDAVAPLSMADVTLTIDNSQGLMPIAFTEVAITRRVYRSGESECFINQSPCRLKDIQELFLGTGLGGGNYAIIEQGHIDMILSSKPEERRKVFEEASGVAKYLAKKHETMRRLDEVEEHLIRIADIIGEVRRQVAALERAANKARQYQAQWEQLKQSELRLAVDEISSGATRAAQAEAQLKTLQEQRQQLEQEKQTHMASLETLNASVSAMQQQAQAARAKVAECVSQMEQHESQSALKTRWIDEVAASHRQMALEEQRLQERLGHLEQEAARVDGALAELRAQQETIRGQLAQHDQERAGLEAAIAQALQAVTAAKARLFEVASNATAQRNQVTELTSRLQGISAHIARLETHDQHDHAKREDLLARHHQLTQERDTLRAAYEEVQGRAGTAQQALEVAGVRRHELSGELHQLRDHLARARAQAGLFEEVWRRHEGFSETIKVLLQQSIDGVIGPLVDVVQPVAGYEAVVESALGPLADALVVKDREVLSRCREIITAQQLEGCRFLVLSDCPSSVSAMEPRSAQAAASGAVKQYLRTEPQYQPLMDWVLNDSWMVDDLARLMGLPAAPQGRFISRKGDRWDRRSWRFRGTPAAAQSRLGRKQRWEQTQAQRAALEQEFQEVDTQAKAAETAWQQRLSECEAAKGELSHVAPALHALDAQAAQLALEQQRLEAEQAARHLEQQELQRLRDELAAALQMAEAASRLAAEQQRAIEQSLAQAQASREDAEQRHQHAVMARAQVDASWQSLIERVSTLTARQRELAADRQQALQQQSEKSAQRQEAQQRSQDLAAQVQEHRESSRRLGEERHERERDAETLGQSLAGEEAKRNDILPRLLAVEQQLSSLAQQIQEQSQQLSERAFRRTRLIERLKELYRIDDATLQAEQLSEAAPLTDEQRAAMAEQVQKLRAKLESLGPVSLGSAEEYDELKRRLDFLQTQQQDLAHARDDLKASITQINRTARSQFRETFERIRQEFQGYYARLFQGGEANLILMDEEDVLESGIDIIARPPGKRLQSISLLSGGERALTAVALLFALFKVRPSPLCILDEIDAPLDEANVDRFTRVLEEFLTLSQFILITHNKKTITKADCLYGVTMEEAGISKILSAKLSQSDRPAPAAVAAAS